MELLQVALSAFSLGCSFSLLMFLIIVRPGRK